MYLALWALFSTPQILDNRCPFFPGRKQMLAPSPQGIRQRHKIARAVDPSVLTVEILVAGKIRFASCRLRTFGFNAGCLLFSPAWRRTSERDSGPEQLSWNQCALHAKS